MTQETGKPDRWPRRVAVPVLLVLGLFAIYLANTTVLDEGDAVPTVNLPVALLATGQLSFDPDHFPELFKWKSHPPFIEKDDFFFTSWNDRFGDRTAHHERLVEGDIVGFVGNDFKVRTADDRAEDLVVTVAEPPHQVSGRWTMAVMGVTYTRTAP